MRNPLENAWQQKWIGLEASHPIVQKMATEAQNFCRRLHDQNLNLALLVLVGGSGCGKTHTAERIYRFVDRSRQYLFDNTAWGKKTTLPSAMFCYWPGIVDGFKNGAYEILRDMFAVDCLVIDDVGAENDPSKNAADKLCQILSKRERKHTVITTNVQPASWGERFDRRIEDRLLRNSVTVDLTGVPSYAIYKLCEN